MTARQQAQELADDMYDASFQSYAYCVECAKVAVGKIIKVLDNISLMESGTTKIDFGQSYWKDVLKELDTITFI